MNICIQDTCFEMLVKMKILGPHRRYSQSDCLEDAAQESDFLKIFLGYFNALKFLRTKYKGDKQSLMVDKIIWEKVSSKERLWTNAQGYGQEWYWTAETAEFKNCLKRRKKKRFLRVEK